MRWHQWRNFARGCLWARLGAPLIKKRLHKVQKIEARNAREPCGVGSKSPLKGPDGSRGKVPGGGPGSEPGGAKPAEAPVHFNADSISKANLYTSNC